MKWPSIVILPMLMLPAGYACAKSETIRGHHLSFEQPFTYGLLSGSTLFLYPEQEVTMTDDLMPTRGEVPQAYIKHVKRHVKPMVYLGTIFGLMLPMTIIGSFVMFIRRRLDKNENRHVQEV
jgi:hypothetical protein